MSNYNSLKTTIDANIKPNGNQEITGQILNSVLNQMVNILGTGYQFMGVATIDTNPGTPDAKVFYIANGKGIYEKFGGINVTEDEVVVLYWDTAWHKVATGIASQAKLSELEERTSQIKKEETGTEGDEIVIEDKDGNAVVKITAEGLFVNEDGYKKVSTRNDLSSKEDLNNKKTNLDNPNDTSYPTTKAVVDAIAEEGIKQYPIGKEEVSSYDDEQIFTNDAETETYAKIGSYGIRAKSFTDLDGNPINGNSPANIIKGKKIVSLCDSLGEGNSGIYWQKVVADRCGSTFIYGNGRELIAGGTKTLNASGECGMDRARNLVANYSDADVILIENINDHSSKSDGSVADLPFMLKNNVLYGTTYASSTLARQALPSAISSVSPKVGTMIRIPYTKSGYKIVVSGNATSQGSIVFNFSDGVSVGSPTINNGDSLATILSKIKSAEWSQYGFSATTGSNYVIISDIEDRANTPTITSINNGVGGVSLATPISADTTNYLGFCFYSYNVVEWNDTSKWMEWENISLHSIYKGLFEYLMTNMPKAQIYFVMFPRLYHYGTSQSKRADGSYNWDAFEYKIEQLCTIQKDCCEYMRVEYADLLHHCGINVYNMLQYFPEKNVHPTKEGYLYFGEQITRLLF